PFRSHAILDFGGIVLTPAGELDTRWDGVVRPQALAFAPTLDGLHRALASFIERRGLSVRVRRLDDFGMPLYLVMKHPAGDLAELAAVEEHLSELDLEGVFVHSNDNNLSLVPTFLGKEKAVAYLLEHHYRDEPT